MLVMKAKTALWSWGYTEVEMEIPSLIEFPYKYKWAIYKYGYA